MVAFMDARARRVVLLCGHAIDFSLKGRIDWSIVCSNDGCRLKNLLTASRSL